MCVSVVKNPTTLFIQLASSNLELDPLIKTMTEHYNGLPPMRCPNFKPGDLVAAVYEDDKTWHRARVVEVTPEVSVAKSLRLRL